ncbi:MAG: OmpA family protein [Treponema sp.]|nr:OmpA family protein [Treponema sp.]
MKLSRMLMFIFSALALCSPRAGAIDFTFQFREGDKSRILSTVHHDIFVNRVFSYRSEIVNRITVEVAEVFDGSTSAGEAGSARLRATFQSAERTVPVDSAGRMENLQASLFEWSQVYHSEFVQNRLGTVAVPPQYFKPMIRNVPVFPDRPLQEGNFWSAPGVVVHDFRDSLGIERPFEIPLHAMYTFLGEREWRGKNYPAFSVSYRLTYRPDPVSGTVYPRRIDMSSDMTVFWDMAAGQITAYEEQFRTALELSNGDTWEYRGRAEAEVIEAPPMAREELLREIERDIAHIPDAVARLSDEGIVISLQDIQFEPDSAVLMPGENAKLNAIAEILLRHKDRDVLVAGHTALAGNAASRMQLSLERAGTVADYLLRRNVRSPDRVVIRGYGAEQPVATNQTIEGMRRNRRVEITILEN